jgi:hypothetical protein
MSFIFSAFLTNPYAAQANGYCLFKDGAEFSQNKPYDHYSQKKAKEDQG